MSRPLMVKVRALTQGVNRSVRPEFSLLSTVTRLAASVALVGSISVGALPVAGLVLSTPAKAQQLRQRDPNAQLLLKADQLIYDNDAETVTAVGDVQLDYDGYNVVAERVTYNQKTRRVKATGNVEIIEPDGNKIFADEIDLTDDFGVGFVNSLRVETVDNTTFAAESAERTGDDVTVFNQGVYTACKACPSSPEKPPLWQIKAQKVIVDGKTKIVHYEKARFELFGRPILYLPYFSHADPSVKRKSGFIFGNAGFDEDLGFWYRQPYFFATGANHDLTVAATGYTNQGLLLDAEWRHQLENGFYTFKVAGIDQQQPENFSSPPDTDQDERGMIGTTGRFDINPRWAFGWNLLAQSDKNFSRTYGISGFSAQEQTNEVYLRGLHDRSYFDASVYQFLIQDDLITDANEFIREDEQAIVRPILDYNYVKTGPVTGGEVSLDFNVTSLERDELDETIPSSGDVRTNGFAGDTTRISADLAWKKTYTTAAGLMLTPSLSLRGDWTTTDGFSNSETLEDDVARFMPTAGFQVAYPLLVRGAYSSHVFEPLAQVFVRPDLNDDGVIPNEDAQSLVFDASTLFERDKFSGYDRIESGTRANVGIRYAGTFNNGLALNGIFGQSFHLAGENPYGREDDLANTGEDSGLESDRSDYVGSLSATMPSGFGLNLQGRFDEEDFGLRRGEFSMNYAGSRTKLSARYAFIDAQPDAVLEEDRHQIGASGEFKIDENWSIFGSAEYDFQDQLFVRDSVGISYYCDCFTLSIAFSEQRNSGGDLDRSVGFKVRLRTLGDFGSTVSGEAFEDLRNNTLFSNN